jgi:molybdate transport system substrate-binding protein
MCIPFRRAGRVFLGFVLTMAALPAFAADLNVLTSAAFKPVLLDLARSFQAHTGNTLTISADSTGGVTARVARGGEEIDLIILPADAVDALAAQGTIAADSVIPVAKSGIGVVVKKDAPLPDISSVEAFKSSMLQAESVAYIDPESGAPDGVYLAKLFDRLGIAEAMQRKAVLVPGGLTASRVDNGEAAIALQQISQLRAVSGVTMAGPLPPEIQKYTIYAGGIPVAMRRPADAKALVAYLRSEAARPALTARGFEVP